MRSGQKISYIDTLRSSKEANGHFSIIVITFTGRMVFFEMGTNVMIFFLFCFPIEVCSAQLPNSKNTPTVFPPKNPKFSHPMDLFPSSREEPEQSRNKYGDVIFSGLRLFLLLSPSRYAYIFLQSPPSTPTYDGYCTTCCQTRAKYVEEFKAYANDQTFRADDILPMVKFIDNPESLVFWSWNRVLLLMVILNPYMKITTFLSQ